MEARSVSVVDRRAWWSAQRKHYNIALIVAAPLSLVATFIVWVLFEDRLPCLEITGFTIFASVPLFLIGFALANVCYLLGPLSERIVRPRNVTFFRTWVYRAGLAFSVLVVFTPAILNLIAGVLGPLPCTDKFGRRHGVGATPPGIDDRRLMLIVEHAAIHVNAEVLLKAALMGSFCPPAKVPPQALDQGRARLTVPQSCRPPRL